MAVENERLRKQPLQRLTSQKARILLSLDCESEVRANSTVHATILEPITVHVCPFIAPPYPGAGHRVKDEEPRLDSK
jgi:hypothetical protein